MNHYPKGGMCRSCAWASTDCSKLPFSKMPVYRRDGEDIVVICTQFLRHVPVSEGKK